MGQDETFFGEDFRSLDRSLLSEADIWSRMTSILMKSPQPISATNGRCGRLLRRSGAGRIGQQATPLG